MRVERLETIGKEARAARIDSDRKLESGAGLSWFSSDRAM